MPSGTKYVQARCNYEKFLPIWLYYNPFVFDNRDPLKRSHKKKG
jgi:hypothetical protein